MERRVAPAYPRTWLRSRTTVHRAVDALLADLRANAEKRLNLGAGTQLIEGMLNCDLHNPEADLKVDATDLSRFEDGAVDHIEAHHMIEHLSFEEVDVALKEWGRVMKRGGVLVLTCPDLTRVCIRWLKHTLIYPLNPRPADLDYTIKMFVGSQEHAGMFHKSGYDARKMRRLLPEYGFEVEFTYSSYPVRTTPSLLTIARRW